MYAVIKTSGDHEVKPFEELVKGDKVIASYEEEWEAEEHADYLNQQLWRSQELTSQTDAWRERNFG